MSGFYICKNLGVKEGEGIHWKAVNSERLWYHHIRKQSLGSLKYTSIL